MKIKKIFLLFFIFFCSICLYAQNKLPHGYRNIQLGMSLDETKLELIKDPDFGYFGDRDVSLIPGSEQILIETDSTRKYKDSYLTQCWFQFYDDTLYTMTLNINTAKIDYYSMFTTLSKKYGNPDSLDPQKAVWKDEEVTVILEKPLSVKYIDNFTKDMLSNFSVINKAAEEISKQSFLDEF